MHGHACMHGERWSISMTCQSWPWLECAAQAVSAAEMEEHQLGSGASTHAHMSQCRALRVSVQFQRARCV